MSSFQQAFKDVSKLVQTFKDNESYYLSPQYQEVEARRDFIDRLFMALGWDVKHDVQKNPYAQEVKVETLVQIAHAQKRADYSFYLAPDFNTVKFFVEAKKPSRNLANNKDDFFQTVRYGWNAGTPLAVLTDFEEFIVLDCRFQPKIDDILNAKLLVFHYSDYAKEDKFREIYHLFSREALSGDSLSNYASALPKPRGKAVQKGLFPGGYISIDEAFLEDLDDIRLALARSFKHNDNSLTSDELTEATQRTIDRLVFLRFLEDKLIEPHHYISEFGDRKSAWEDFISASRTLDAKYNGVVFKKHNIDSRNFVGPDDKTFSGICEDLSHINSPYNFDVIPIHILGSIYERFLGKVVHATAKRANIEEKPEVRKAGGVYYTPQYIVNYIVSNTVGKLIEDKTPRQISKLRFADIACGSGSFLIKVFEILLEHHKKWYQENPEQAKKDGCLYLEDAWRLTLKQKQKILTNNIFGVDLDQQAVEVTQFSLYLKLLEDETTATANDSWVMFKEQLLPDLYKNIICGNSLIGTDFLENNLFNFEDEKKIKPMNFEGVFPDIMLKGGFDAIVGNPPYLKIEHIAEIERDYFSNSYESFIKRYDTYGLFVERGIEISNENGILGLIIPSTILNNLSFVNLRKYLLQNVSIQRITNLGGKVFRGVNNDTLILICSKPKHKKIKSEVYDVVNYGEKIDTAKLTARLDLQKMSQPPNYTFELRVTDFLVGLLNKIQNKSTPLSEICSCFQGFVTGSNDAYIIDRKTIINEKLNKNLCYLSVFGKEVGRYNIPVPRYFIIYLTKDDDLMEYPKVRKRLEHYKSFLSNKREVKLGRQPWYSLHWPRKKENYLRPEKILVQAIRNLSLKRRLVATLDKNKLFADHTLSVIYTDQEQYNIRYILAILNSNLINYIFSKKYIDINIKGIYLLVIPIKTINFDNHNDKLNHDTIVKLVNQILATKKQLLQVKTEGDKIYLERKCGRLDKEIDQLVYQLYGLTEEEIKIVEESQK